MKKTIYILINLILIHFTYANEQPHARLENYFDQIIALTLDDHTDQLF